ncbi:MAG: REP-associated tyrosine transposase [Verrucomicrobiota bacterium]
MGGPIREQNHRLPPQAYRGNVIGAFTVNTDGRFPFFDDSACVVEASRALTEAFAQYGGHVGVHVFMPEHLHLIVSGQAEVGDLLGMLKGFKQKTTFRLRKAGKVFAWQKDFYDHLIRRNEDYGAQVRYLLRNPVRRGLCERWQDWPHQGVLGQTWEQLALAIAPL